MAGRVIKIIRQDLGEASSVAHRRRGAGPAEKELIEEAATQVLEARACLASRWTGTSEASRRRRRHVAGLHDQARADVPSDRRS